MIDPVAAAQAAAVLATAILGGLGGIQLQRVKHRKEERAAEQEARTASQSADDDVWKRTKDLLGTYETRLKQMQADHDAAMKEIRAELRTSEQLNEDANRACDERVARVTRALEDELQQTRDRLVKLSATCVEQQLDLDQMTIAQSRMKRQLDMQTPSAATADGGRRAGDTVIGGG